MIWKKLGWTFCADNNHPLMKTHAANPVAECLDSSTVRVYFSARDERQRASIGFVDLDGKSDFFVVRVCREPELTPGGVGLFDDSGVSMGCLLNIGGEKHLFYLGWNLGVTVPWRNSIGLAVYDPKSAMFERVSQAPILDRGDVDPYSISYPFVPQGQRGRKLNKGPHRRGPEWAPD